MTVPNKFGRIRTFDYIINNISKEEIRTDSEFFEYSYYLNLNQNIYVEVKNAVIIPIDDVKPLDISKNGYFWVGTDIFSDKCSFKINSNYIIGIAAKHNSDNILNTNHKLSKGNILYKYGMDIYDKKTK